MKKIWQRIKEAWNTPMTNLQAAVCIPAMFGFLALYMHIGSSRVGKVPTVSLEACTKQEATQAATVTKNVTTKVTDEYCKEEEGAPDEPGWVKVACAAEGVLVHVILPATEWGAIKMRTAHRIHPHDAGADQ